MNKIAIRKGRAGICSGYTLLEMLIVLGILVTLASLVLPAMRGPLDKSRLRAASREVRSAIAKARSFSIREGAQVEFRYQVNGRRWKIQRVPAFQNPGQFDNDLTTTASGLSINQSTENSEAETSELELSEQDILQTNSSAIFREGEIPVTVSFTQPVQEDSELSEQTLGFEQDQPTTEDVIADINGEQILWSQPIRFMPNGRTEDAIIKLAGNRNFFVDINLRGLTGAVSYSAPFRVVAEPGLQTQQPEAGE